MKQKWHHITITIKLKIHTKNDCQLDFNDEDFGDDTIVELEGIRKNMISRLTHGMSWHYMMRMKRYSIMQQIPYLDFIYVRRITPRRKYLDYFSEHDPMKSYYQGRLLHEQGKIKEAYEKYENVIFYGFSTLNFVLSTMAGLALRENDIGYARFLSGKDVEGTYKVVKHLLDNVGTMYDFRKSGLYKHMKFRDIDEAILDGVKEKLLEGFRNEEEFGYMAGYEPWEKLIFDR